MKTLTLRIENHTTLDNGGPVSIALAGRGAQIGRKAGNDWVLPDPSRHISGHHLDVVVENGQYLLTDVSSNGTFLHGERYRIDGAHVIQDGDRFTIGHYIIRASLEGEAPPPPQPAPQPGDEFDDVWGSPPPQQNPPSVPPGLQAPPGSQNVGQGQTPYGQSSGTQQPDFQRLSQTGRATATTPPPSMPALPAQARPKTGLSVPPAFSQLQQPQQQQQPPRQQHALAPPPAPPQAPAPYPPQVSSEGFGGAQQPLPTHPQPNFAAPPPQGGGSDAMLHGFLEGAGLAGNAQTAIPPEELGRILGRIARQGTQDLMHMLQDRAAVKLFVSNEDRTMRVASGNNPMKFMLDANQAFEALFLNPRDGYQTGADGFENALSDVRRHQTAVIAAMQPALAEVLDGLSPEDIEETTGGGVLGGGGRKAWDEFTKRWEARAAMGENGMLDAFIKAFSKHYSEALRKR